MSTVFFYVENINMLLLKRNLVINHLNEFLSKKRLLNYSLKVQQNFHKNVLYM